MDPEDITTEEESEEVFVVVVPEGEGEEFVFPIVDEDEAAELLAEL